MNEEQHIRKLERELVQSRRETSRLLSGIYNTIDYLNVGVDMYGGSARAQTIRDRLRDVVDEFLAVRGEGQKQPTNVDQAEPKKGVNDINYVLSLFRGNHLTSANAIALISKLSGAKITFDLSVHGLTRVNALLPDGKNRVFFHDDERIALDAAFRWVIDEHSEHQ